MNDAFDNAHFLFRRHQFVGHTEATCLACQAVYAVTAITRWIDGGTTPVCPRCQYDFVAPGRLAPEVLAAARARLFEPWEGMEPLKPGDWA